MHEIDMSNGKANMAYVNDVPWHGLGQKLSVGAPIDTWKTEAGLDWQAIASPVTFKDQKGQQQEWDERCVLYRSDTGLPLSVVSNRYNSVQPTQVLEFFRDIVEKYKAFSIETAGSLRGGRKIWALARADDELVVAGGDAVKRYLLLATSYDQTLPTVVQQTSVRVVCNNTLTAAFSEGAAGNELQQRISHITKFNADVVKAEMALNEQWQLFTVAVKQLAAKKAGDKIAREYFLDVFYPEEVRVKTAFSQKGADKRVEELMSVLKNAPGQDIKSAKGTAWGMLNAVTYFVDHTIRSKNQDARLDKAWFGDNAVVKARAFKRALAFAGA
jgi:phage/plasmid-like protein (TIGR03299 family)